jgi:hypothetical protein
VEDTFLDDAAAGVSCRLQVLESGSRGTASQQLATGEGNDPMDREAWEREWAEAWDEFRQAQQALDDAMPKGQFGLSALAESIDLAQVERLKNESDKAWDRITELGAKRPTS